jgi:hypothetical protein
MTRTNEDARQNMENLVHAETTIGAAAQKLGLRWTWAPWGKPSTGGPFMWNDIVVTDSDGKSQVIEAKEFTERAAEEDRD